PEAALERAARIVVLNAIADEVRERTVILRDVQLDPHFARRGQQQRSVPFVELQRLEATLEKKVRRFIGALGHVRLLGGNPQSNAYLRETSMCGRRGRRYRLLASPMHVTRSTATRPPCDSFVPPTRHPQPLSSPDAAAGAQFRPPSGHVEAVGETHVLSLHR